jgi:dolichyl-diphosphooligosaccharide--protein glycosyltransferase
VFSYGAVFRGDAVVFQDTDAVFHVRTIENLVHNFPYRSGMDPYSRFPRGQDVDTGPFHDYVIGTIAWIGGLGGHNQHLTDVVAAWYPALLGALMVVPIYLLGRDLFSPIVGGVAAGLIALLPGVFLWVSRLGNPDHHVTEVMLSTLLLLLMVRALLGKPTAWMVALMGIVLGCYLTTRPAGAFLVVIIEIWAMAQVIRNHLSGEGSRMIWVVTVPPLGIGWFLFYLAGPTLWANVTSLVLFAGVVAITGAAALSKGMRSRSRYLYPLVLVGLTVAFVWGTILVKPHLVEVVFETLRGRTTAQAQTVGELRPLLTATGSFSLQPAWAEFGTCWLLAPMALCYVGWRAVVANTPAQMLFFTWSVLMMLAAFWQIRNCSYFAVNVALLTGVASEYLLRHERRHDRIFAASILAIALLVPNAMGAYTLVSEDHGPRPEWRKALAFLRDATPEPFGDASAFHRYFPRQEFGSTFAYPVSAYGILSWWDFGHWISGYGRRIPIANGMQSGAVEAALYFTSTTPSEAAALLRRFGARYVIVDSSMPIGGNRIFQPPVGSFGAMLEWASKNSGDYWEPFLGSVPGNEAAEFPVYYPAYYQSMMARLFLFDGRAQLPKGSTRVIQYVEEVREGRVRKRMKRSQSFSTYDEAKRYVAANPGQKLIIGGISPLDSCVPIDELVGYKLVYPAEQLTMEKDGARRDVKVFEYSQVWPTARAEAISSESTKSH